MDDPNPARAVHFVCSCAPGACVGYPPDRGCRRELAREVRDRPVGPLPSSRDTERRLNLHREAIAKHGERIAALEQEPARNEDPPDSGQLRESTMPCNCSLCKLGRSDELSRRLMAGATGDTDHAQELAEPRWSDPDFPQKIRERVSGMGTAPTDVEWKSTKLDNGATLYESAARARCEQCKTDSGQEHALDCPNRPDCCCGRMGCKTDLRLRSLEMLNKTRPTEAVSTGRSTQAASQEAVSEDVLEDIRQLASQAGYDLEEWQVGTVARLLAQMEAFALAMNAGRDSVREVVDMLSLSIDPAGERAAVDPPGTP